MHHLVSIFVLLSVWILMSAPTANASCFPIFSQDGTKATFILQSFSGDKDATRLFEILNAEPVELAGKISKRAAFTVDGMNKLFDVVCAISKLVPTTGSCTIILRSSAFVVIDASSRYARLRLTGEEARSFAGLFSPNSGDVFRSGDGHLVFIRSESENSFVIEFQ